MELKEDSRNPIFGRPDDSQPVIAVNAGYDAADSTMLLVEKLTKYKRLYENLKNLALTDKDCHDESKSALYTVWILIELWRSGSVNLEDLKAKKVHTDGFNSELFENAFYEILDELEGA